LLYKQPLVNVETIINLIGSMTTTTGLKVGCEKDDGKYEIGKKISDVDFKKINEGVNFSVSE